MKNCFLFTHEGTGMKQATVGALYEVVWRTEKREDIKLQIVLLKYKKYGN